MNKSDKIYEQKQLIADFIGCKCFGINEEVKLSDYDDAIQEIMCMIAYNVLAVLESVFEKYGMGFGGSSGGFAGNVPKAVKSIPAAFNVGVLVQIRL